MTPLELLMDKDILVVTKISHSSTTTTTTHPHVSTLDLKIEGRILYNQNFRSTYKITNLIMASAYLSVTVLCFICLSPSLVFSVPHSPPQQVLP